MFGKIHEISLGHVHDKIMIKEGDESIILKIDADPDRMISGLRIAQEKLQSLNKDSTDDEYKEASSLFAEAIFGKQQTEELFSFYRGDATCVINVSSRYFNERLTKLITREQKRRRRLMEK